MTITDTGRRSTDDLVAEARRMIRDGRLPSQNALRNELKVGWDRAGEIRDAASRQLAAERAGRRREARATMKRLAAKRRPGRSVVIDRNPSPARPDDPADESITPVQAVSGRPSEALLPPGPEPAAAVAAETATGRVAVGPVELPPAASRKRPKSWPLLLLALPAFAAVWSGWVGLGGLTGFGVVQPFPGIPGLSGVRLDTAITLPIGVETYGAYALYVWLSAGAVTTLARRFAMWSAFGSLAFGAAGQVAFHQMVAAGITSAPWQITTIVACLPVAVLGMGAALRHLVHAEEN